MHVIAAAGGAAAAASGQHRQQPTLATVLPADTTQAVQSHLAGLLVVKMWWDRMLLIAAGIAAASVCVNQCSCIYCQLLLLLFIVLAPGVFVFRSGGRQPVH